MEGMVSAIDQQALVSSFLEVAQGQTAATARQFLQVRLTSLSLFFFFCIITVTNGFPCCWIFNPLKCVNFSCEAFESWIIVDSRVVVVLRSNKIWCVCLTGYELETWGSSSVVLDWEWIWGGATAGTIVFYSTFRKHWVLYWSITFKVMPVIGLWFWS